MRSRPRRPWQTLHTDTDRQKHRQLRVTVLVLGNLEVKTPTFFHKKREQILASLLQKQELTKTVTSDNHFLISVFRRGWVPSTLRFFSPCSVGSSPRVLWNRRGEKGREREKGRTEKRRGKYLKKNF